MVWKIRCSTWNVVAVCVCVFLIVLGTSRIAHADTVYDGSLSTTYVTYWEDILNTYAAGVDYVGFRSGQYEYKLVTGDLKYENGVFSGGEVVSHTFDTSGGSYNNTLSYDVSEERNFTLTPSNKLVYSNLGGYPDVVERGSDYEVLTLLAVCIIGLCALLRPVFDFTSRLCGR